MKMRSRIYRDFSLAEKVLQQKKKRSQAETEKNLNKSLQEKFCPES